MGDCILAESARQRLRPEGAGMLVWDDDLVITLRRAYLIESCKIHVFQYSRGEMSSSAGPNTRSPRSRRLAGIAKIDWDLLKEKRILSSSVRLSLTDLSVIEAKLFIGYFPEVLPAQISKSRQLRIVTRISAGMYGKVWKGSFDVHKVAIKAALPVSNEELDAKIELMRRQGELPDEFDEEHRPTLKTMLEDERIQQLLNEIDALRSIGQHDNIVKYFGAEYSKRKLYVVTALQDGNVSSLITLAAKLPPLSPGEPAADFRQATTKNPNAFIRLFQQSLQLRLQWCWQIACGLQHMHQQNWMHGDIKPENILYSIENLSIKLADFGFSQLINDQADARHCGGQGRGTALYMAPEVHQNEYHAIPSDIYSYAITFWEILTLKAPFSHLVPFSRKFFERIMDPSVSLDEALRPPLDEIPTHIQSSLFAVVSPDGGPVKSIWHPDYDLRPTMKDILVALDDFQIFSPW